VHVSVLINFGDQILAEDIILPKGVTLLANPKGVVATISAPREEKEEETAPADLSTIEVEKKGKEEKAEAVPEAEQPAL